MNYKNSRNDSIQPEILADLPLASEQAEETKAGAGNVVFLGPPATEPKIGRAGNDVLLGGSGDDLLIAGKTSY